jgi:hypothetical protein
VLCEVLRYVTYRNTLSKVPEIIWFRIINVVVIDGEMGQQSLRFL